MSKASYLKKFKVSSDNVTFHPLPATSPSIDIGGDVLDDTNLATNAGYRSRVLGLSDWSASADSNLVVITGTANDDNASGATAIQIVRTAKLNRTPIYIEYLPTGANDAEGLTGEAVVESFNHSGDVGGLETVAISFQGNGPLSATV